MADKIVIRGAKEHNLKNVSLELPRDKLIVFCGLSGSGKSSLAFDTIYAEGQRRYVESLSSYARQFLGQMDKPDVEIIEGLSPAISIDQKSASRNPRSTVGTVTEVYDYLRLLYARIGTPHDPETGEALVKQTPQQIVDKVLALPHGTRFQVLAPVVRGRKGTYEKLFTDFAKQGFARVRVDGTVHELADITGDTPLELARYETHDIDVIVDRLVLRDDLDRRLTESMETALVLGEGVAQIELLPKEADPEILTFSEKLSRPSDGKSFDELAPRNFSFNSPYGYCPACQGLGMTFEVDPELVVPNAELSIAEGAIAPWAGGHAKYFHRLLESVTEEYGIDDKVVFLDHDSLHLTRRIIRHNLLNCALHHAINRLIDGRRRALHERARRGRKAPDGCRRKRGQPARQQGIAGPDKGRGQGKEVAGMKPLGRRCRSGAIDPHPEHHAVGFAPELHIEDVQPVTRCHTRRCGPNLLDDARFAPHSGS